MAYGDPPFQADKYLGFVKPPELGRRICLQRPRTCLAQPLRGDWKGLQWLQVVCDFLRV